MVPQGDDVLVIRAIVPSTASRKPENQRVIRAMIGKSRKSQSEDESPIKKAIQVTLVADNLREIQSLAMEAIKG